MKSQPELEPRSIEIVRLLGEVNLCNLKFPAEWELMDKDQQEHYITQQLQGNVAPDNIIPFPVQKKIDLNNCF